jgi:hypothetical protein
VAGVPDGFSMSMLTKPATDAMADMAKRTDRATMWALREVGRKVKQESRRRAPVYKGRRATGTYRMMKALQKAGAGGKLTNDVVVSGLLKNSISSSRRLKREAGGAYVIKVGPRGDRVHLYAGKQEERARFMRQAYDVVAPAMSDIHAKAWAKAMGKK